MKLLCLITLSCCLAASLSGQNLLKNGDFSQNMSGWSVTDWKIARGTVRVADSAAELVNDDPAQYTMLQQTVNLKPNAKYHLSFQVKGRGIQSNGKKNSGASVMILNQGNFVFEFSPAGKWKSAAGDFDWQKAEDQFSTGKISGTSTLYLVLRHAPGAASFSDIVLTEAAAEAPVANTVSVRLLPVELQKGVYHLARNFPGTLLAELKGPARTQPLTLEMQLPDGVSCLGASPWLPSGTDAGGTLKFDRDPAAADGSTISIAVNPLIARQLRPDRLEWNNYERIYLLAGPDAREGKVRYRAWSGDQPSGEYREFQLKVLPELASGEPRLSRFGITMAYLDSLSAPYPQVRESCLNYWLGLAERPSTFTPFRWNQYPEELRRMVLEKFDCSAFIGGRYCSPLGPLKSWQEKAGVNIPPTVLDDGKEVEWACPSYLTDQPDSPFWNGYVPQLVRERIQNTSAPRLIWDIEPGAMSFCFCETCRRKFSDLQDKPLLSVQDIKKQFPAAWFEFRVRQNAAVINQFPAAVKRHFPDLELVLCTDPLHAKPPHVQEWCGVDVRMSDHGQYGLFMNMPYYSGLPYFDDLAFNLKSLKTPQYPLIDPSENIEMFYSRYTPESVRVNMLATAALGAKGIGFWPGDNFDARYLHRIREAATQIARGENYYSGKRCDSLAVLTPENAAEITIRDQDREVKALIPDFRSSLRHTLHETDGNYLLTVFNYHGSESVLLNVRLPRLEKPETFRVRDLNSNSLYAAANPREGFLAEVPSGDVLLLEITRDPITAGEIAGHLSLRKKLDEFKRRSSSIDKFTTQIHGRDSIGWGVLPGDSRPLVKMVQNGRQVYLDPSAGGAITALMPDAYQDLLYHDTRGMLDEFILFGCGKTVDFEVSNMKIAAGRIELELFHRVPPVENADPNAPNLGGVEIRKTVILTDNGRKLHSCYELTAPAAVKTSFRLRNFPRIGEATPGKPLSASWQVIIPAADKSVILRTGAAPNNLVLAPAMQNPFGNMRAEILSRQYDGQPITLKAGAGRQQRELKFELDQPGGCLVWWSETGPSTVEPFTLVQELSPGRTWRVNSVITWQ